jgi:nitrite reductase (cytochrome c-552)
LGFHADQEAVRVLGESIDYSRQAESAALRLRAPAAPAATREAAPVEGVTPSEKVPANSGEQPKSEANAEKK